MRILQLHCDHIEYTPTKKEIQSAEDIENPETKRFEEIVVAFVAIEDGDDKKFYGTNWLQKIITISICSSQL